MENDITHDDSDRSLQLIFPTVIDRYMIPNADRVNRGLVEALVALRRETPNARLDGYSSDVYTTFGVEDRLYERADFAPIGDWMRECFAAHAVRMDYALSPQGVRLTECWVNVYEKGFAHELHTHPNNILSGVYYVKAPVGCSELRFHAPHAFSMMQQRKRVDSELNLLSHAVQPREGEFIIFNSAVKHNVPPNAVDAERIIIAANALL